MPPGFRRRELDVRQASTVIKDLGLDRVDLIKIDVEGMEEAILTSLRPVLNQYRPIVAFEHHETRVDGGAFARIRNCFPADYKLVEAQFSPDGSPWQKALWNVRHDAGPVLSEVISPEARSYEALLAIPDEA